MGLPGLLHQSGGTFMMNNTMMTNTMRPGIGGLNQCRQPPAYKVAAQMARLHRLGRAHSHDGVAYRTNHEDGTANNAYNLHTFIFYILNIIFHTPCIFSYIYSLNHIPNSRANVPDYYDSYPRITLEQYAR